MNNSNIIDFNFIPYVLIFVENVLMTWFGKKKPSIIVLMSNSSCLKIVQNLLEVLYTFVHLAHFSCTVSVISLYSECNTLVQ